jgi:UDP-N-acetylmuramoylalanine-D-glutamate ligase
MKLGIVGLGRMGAAMSRRLRLEGFDVTGWDQNAKANQALAADGLPIAANAPASPRSPRSSFPASPKTTACERFSPAPQVSSTATSRASSSSR